MRDKTPPTFRRSGSHMYHRYRCYVVAEEPSFLNVRPEFGEITAGDTTYTVRVGLMNALLPRPGCQWYKIIRKVDLQRSLLRTATSQRLGRSHWPKLDPKLPRNWPRRLQRETWRRLMGTQIRWRLRPKIKKCLRFEGTSSITIVFWRMRYTPRILDAQTCTALKLVLITISLWDGGIF